MNARSPVRLGYLPQVLSDREHLATLLAAVERAGLDHVAVGDHVSFHTGIGFDGLVNATALTMLHPTLPVHTAVYLLPLRHPLTVARQIASLDQLSPGRLVFGVGIGGEDRREVSNCGVDPRTRGRRANECLEVLRPLLAGERVDYDGQFIQLEKASIWPAPKEEVPILVGGRSDAAITRAGRYADGWLGLWVTHERWCEVMEQFNDAANAAGRSIENPRHALMVWCGVGATREEARDQVAPRMEMLYQTPFDKFEQYVPYGTPADVAEFIQPYVESGVCDLEMIVIANDEWEAIAAAGEIRRHLHGNA